MQTTLTSQAPAVDYFASLLHCLCARRRDGIGTTRQHCFRNTNTARIFSRNLAHSVSRTGRAWVLACNDTQFASAFESSELAFFAKSAQRVNDDDRDGDDRVFIRDESFSHTARDSARIKWFAASVPRLVRSRLAALALCGGRGSRLHLNAGPATIRSDPHGFQFGAFARKGADAA